MNSEGHVGDLVSALVDGALDHDTRDRLLAHLAGCPACRAEVEDERRLKARLTGLADPELPADLVSRLRAIATPAPAEPDDAESPAVAIPAAAFIGSLTNGTSDGRPRSRRDSRRPAQRRSARRRVAASTGGFLAAALSVAFVVGGGGAEGRAVTPQVDQFTVDHAAVTGEVPLTGPAGTGVTVSFARSGTP